METYIAYGDIELAEDIAEALRAAGMSSGLMHEHDKDPLSADVLVLAVENAEQLEKLQPVWRDFLDAIDWKRKPDGNMVIVSRAPLKSAYVPFRLKRFLACTDPEEVVTHLTADTQDTAQASPRVEAPEQIRYTPPTASEASKPFASSGCKQDHIFEETPYQADPDPQPAKKRSGCAWAFVVILVIAGVIIATAIARSSYLPF